jgi:hypothetical protein
MKREPILHHAGMNAAPIVGLLAGKHLARALACDLLPIDIAELSSCQSEGGVVQSVPEIDQADRGKESRDLERIKIGSGGHAPRARRLKPIIE